MEVWTTERKHEKFGAERWLVSWYTLRQNWQPRYEGDHPDIDNDLQEHAETCHSEGAATARARELIERDFFGCPSIQRQRVEWFVEEDRVAHWEDAGEPIYADA